MRSTGRVQMASGSSPRTTYSLSMVTSAVAGNLLLQHVMARAETRSVSATNRTTGATSRRAASFMKPISSDILKNSSKAWKPRSITLAMPSSTIRRSISAILP